MGVAGSPPTERSGGRHRQVAGVSDTEASRPSGGETGILHFAGTAGARAGKNENCSFFVNWWRQTCRQIWKHLAWTSQSVRESGSSCVSFRSPSPTKKQRVAPPESGVTGPDGGRERRHLPFRHELEHGRRECESGLTCFISQLGTASPGMWCVCRKPSIVSKTWISQEVTLCTRQVIVHREGSDVQLF